MCTKFYLNVLRHSAHTLFYYSSVIIELPIDNLLFFSRCVCEIKHTIAFVLDVPTIVETNILIRSMGPVSELDMVIQINILQHKHLLHNSTFPICFRNIPWIAISGNTGETKDCPF